MTVDDFHHRCWHPSVLKFLHDRGYSFIETLYVSEDPQGAKVGRFHHDQEGFVVIKAGPYLEYEYRIGQRLQALVQELSPEYQIVVKTFAWFPSLATQLMTDVANKDNESSINASDQLDSQDVRESPIDIGPYLADEYLVVEYLPGIHVDLLMQSLPVLDREGQNVLLGRYLAMVQRILELQRRLDFTHYDLHLGNIITDDGLQTFKIIDFGYSHLTEVVGRANLPDGALGIGVMPTVKDPWYDIVRLVVLLYSYVDPGQVPENIASLLLSNGFSPWISIGPPNQEPQQRSEGSDGQDIMLSDPTQDDDQHDLLDTKPVGERSVGDLLQSNPISCKAKGQSNDQYETKRSIGDPKGSNDEATHSKDETEQQEQPKESQDSAPFVPEWISLEVQTYPGSELIPGMEILYVFPSWVWEDGFEVKEHDEALSLRRYMINQHDDLSRTFMELMLRLKLSAMRRRLIRGGPELLMFLFEQDLCQRFGLSPLSSVNGAVLEGNGTASLSELLIR